MSEYIKEFKFYGEKFNLIKNPRGMNIINIQIKLKPKNIEYLYDKVYLTELHAKFEFVGILIIEFDCSFMYYSIMPNKHMKIIMDNRNKKRLFMGQLTKLTISDVYDVSKQIFIKNNLNPKGFPSKEIIMKQLGVI